MVQLIYKFLSGRQGVIEVDNQVPLHPLKTLLDFIREKEGIPPEYTLKYTNLSEESTTVNDLGGVVNIQIKLPPETPPPGLAGGGKKKYRKNKKKSKKRTRRQRR